MKKVFYFILSLVFLSPYLSFGQGEMLLLKKNNKVFKTYYVGSTIMADIGMGWQESLITAMRNDSMELTQYQFGHRLNNMGLVVVDTVGQVHTMIPYTWIQRIGILRKGFSLNSVGTVLFSGGAALTVAGLFARLIAKKNSQYYPTDNYLITAGGLTAGGFLLSRVHADKSWPIGKKYSLEFISTH